jgi:hypothetical protein
MKNSFVLLRIQHLAEACVRYIIQRNQAPATIKLCFRVPGAFSIF